MVDVLMVLAEQIHLVDATDTAYKTFDTINLSGLCHESFVLGPAHTEKLDFAPITKRHAPPDQDLVRHHLSVYLAIFLSGCVGTVGSGPEAEGPPVPDAASLPAEDAGPTALPAADAAPLLVADDAAVLPVADDAAVLPDAAQPLAADAAQPPPDAGVAFADAGPVAPTCTGDLIGQLPKGPSQLTALCSRGYTDPISVAFCAATTPSITSVTDVLNTIGLGFGAPPYTRARGPSFVMSSQSTSISARKVSQINPRAIVFTMPLARGRMTGAPRPNPSFVAFSFTRGDQEIELMAKDPQVGIRFFLLKYAQACNGAPGGCNSGDLYTSAVESGFTGWSLYSDEDLKNTPHDCLQCHQPGGLGTPRIMRMQELQRPWHHWMYNDSIGVAPLRADFHAAHGTTEAYGGVPGAAIDQGDAPQLQGFVENNGFQNQPNEFMGLTIASEVMAGGSSATWQSMYQRAQGGQFIPVPYFDSIATDVTKVQPLINQYRAVATGMLPRNQLGDMSDVFSVAAQRAMTHRPASGLSGRQILVQACQQCHNSRLDPTISRSTFDVERLDMMPRSEKDEAIRRIHLPTNDCNHMPPHRFRELDAAEIALVEAELRN